MLISKSNLAQLGLPVLQRLINNPAMLIPPKQAKIQHINGAKRRNPQLAHLQNRIAEPKPVKKLLLGPIRAEAHHPALLILNPIQMIKAPPPVGQQLLPIRSRLRRLRHCVSTAKNSRGRSPETRMPNRTSRLHMADGSTSCHPRSIVLVLLNRSQALPSLDTSIPAGPYRKQKTRARPRPVYPCPGTPPHPAHSSPPWT